MSLTLHAKIKGSKSPSSGCRLSPPALGGHFSLCTVWARCIPIAPLSSEASHRSGYQRQAMGLDGSSVCSAVTSPEPYCVLVYVGKAPVESVCSFKKKKHTLVTVSRPSTCSPSSAGHLVAGIADELGFEGFKEKIVKVWKWSSFPAAM